MQRRLTKDLLAYLPGKALPALAAFITVPVYTHLFAPDVYGTFVLAASIADFLMLATTSGFCSSAVRFFSAYQRKANLPAYFTAIYGGTVVISLLVALLGSGVLLAVRAFAPGLIAPDFATLLWATLVLFVATAWSDTLMHTLRGQERSGWYSFLAASQAFGAIAFSLLLVVVFRTGIVGLIWGQTIAFAITIIPCAWLTTRDLREDGAFRPNRLDRADFQLLWRFAWPVTVGNIAFWVLRCADRYIIEAYRSTYDVGLYALASKLSSRSVDILVSLFLLVPGPIIYRVWEEQGRQATEEVLTRFTRMFLLVIAPAAVGLGVLAAPVVRLLAERAYFDGHRAVFLVALASVGLGLSELGSFGLLVANRTRPIARNWCLAAVAGLLLNFALVPRLGFMGAAVSAAIAFGFLAVLQTATSARFLTWRWPLASLWRVLAAAGAMSAALLVVQSACRSDTTLWQAISLGLSLLAGGAVYLLALALLGEIRLQNLLALFRPPQDAAAVRGTAAVHAARGPE